VYVTAARNIDFERNTFQNLGATGLDFHSGVCDSRIVGNVFADIAGNGVVLAQFKENGQESHGPFVPEDQREICANNLIANNLVTRIAADYFGSIGICCGFARSVRIEHNEIFDCPYSGISLGWGWTSLASPMENNAIRHNHIHGVMRVTTDGAAVYCLSRQPATVIEENYIHDLKKSPHARWAPVVIYLDEGSGGMTIRNNLVEDVETGDKLVHENKLIRTQEEIDLLPNTIGDNGSSVSPDVKAKAGLEPEFRDLLKAI